MSLYNYNNYREFIVSWLKEQPNQGRGLAQRLSKELRVSTVLISQIFNGTRTLQSDYAFGIANFIGLNTNETEFFLTLVEYEHAGTDVYKSYLKKKIEAMKGDAREVKNRVAKDIILSEEVKAQFYSHWHYSAIRLASDIPGVQTARDISEFLNIPLLKVQIILKFLVDKGLCSHEGGKYKMAVQSTHLESDSPWIYSRQLQWRQKSLQSMEVEDENALYYTGPMVISKKDVVLIREMLVKSIKEITDKARQSPSEKLVCLTVDWFAIS